MNKLLLIALTSFIAFACFACDEDEDCEIAEVEEVPEMSTSVTEVYVNVIGPGVADRRVSAETCEHVFLSSGPKDPVNSDATDYWYTFKLKTNVLTYEDGTKIAGEPICYRIYGSPDPNCDVYMQSDEIWLLWGEPPTVEIVYENCD